jgi:alpha-beta hydrolase superfamily lysophospholipase
MAADPHQLEETPVSKRSRGAIAALAGAAGVAALALLRREDPALAAQPSPAVSYGEAMMRFAALRARDGAEVREICRAELLSHGRRVRRAAVLLHGYTSCPRQFHELGQALFERGYNVLIPRMPGHGLLDRMTTETAGITARSLARYTDEVVDIAQGLGEQVTVTGLSGGGVLAAWAAQTRADVALAAPISPVVGVAIYPRWFIRPAAQVLAHAPNRFLWWDPQLRQNIPGTPYDYPRFATRGLAAFITLATWTHRAARRRPPAASSIAVVTNAADAQVSNVDTAELVAAWRAHRAERVRTHEFERALGLPHDLIDPRTAGAKPELVHPALLELLGAG